VIKEPHIEPAELIGHLLPTYLPTLSFEAEERYFPTNAEAFVANSTPSAACGPGKTSNEGCYLSLNDTSPAALAGDLGRARAYLKVVRENMVTRVQVWFLYMFNGHGTARLEIAGQHVDVPLDPCGVHQGDWEHIVLEFSNHTRALDRVYYSIHDGGEWRAPPAGQPQVYVSRNGHASYPRPGAFYNKGGTIGKKPFEIGLGLINFAYGDGRVWDTRGAYQIIAALPGLIYWPALMPKNPHLWRNSAIGVSIQSL